MFIRISLFAVLFATTLVDQLVWAQQENANSFWKVRREVERSFADNIRKLIADCKQNGLSNEVDEISKFLIPRDPKRQYIFVPSQNVVDQPRFQELDQEIKTKLDVELKKHVDRLYQIAVNEAKVGNAGWAFQLFHEILFFDPDNRQVRKILGHRIVGKDDKTWRVKSDRLRVKRATRTEKELGWPAKSYWIASTTHFYVISRASEQQTQELAEKLELWHDIWRQVFFDFYSSQKNLNRWIDGKSKPTQSGRKFKVIFFDSKTEYVVSLKNSIPGVEISTGYYSDRAKKSYFFASDDRSIRETWRHELTHQMFQESQKSVLSPFRDSYLWLGEGIAMYFESLVDHGDFAVLGGFDTRRLQYAKLRRLKEQFRLPINELSQMSMVQFQSLPEIAKAYSQSAGVTQFLMTENDQKYQSGLIQFLAQIYRGKQKQNTIEDLVDLSSSQLEKSYEAFLRTKPGELKYSDPLIRHRELALIGVKLEENTLQRMKLDELDWLDLSASDLRGKRLAGIESASGIGRLFLTGSLIDSDTIEYLKKLPVSEIDFSGTRLSDDQLVELAENPSIKVLNVVETKVTSHGIKTVHFRRQDMQLLSNFNRQ